MDSNTQGFTLIEVLVALVIVAIALPALLMNMGTMSQGSLSSRNVMVAHWVAENKMREVQLIKQIQNIAPRGLQADDVEMGGQVWDIQVEAVVMPPLPVIERSLLRVYVRVSPQGSDSMAAELSSYMLE